MNTWFIVLLILFLLFSIYGTCKALSNVFNFYYPSRILSGPVLQKSTQALRDFYKTSPCIFPFNNKTQYTYGHLTIDGVKALWQLTKRHVPLNTQKLPVFYDLGSGCGELVLNYWLYTGFPCYGIEFVRDRYQNALKAKQHLLDYMNKNKLEAPLGQTPTFMNNDFLKADFSQANIIYISNLCFTKEVSDPLYHKILNSPNVQLLVMSKDVPSNFTDKFARKFSKKYARKIYQSWSRESDIIVYVK